MSLVASPLRLLLIALACVAALCVSGAARAQDAPRMKAAVQPARAEAGEVFAVQMTALVGQRDPAPGSPTLRLPPGVVLRAGPHIGPHVEASMPMGGQPVIRTGISVTWQLEAQRPGRYKIGPPAVQYRGRRYETNPIEVEIVPKGQKPRRGNNPFDPFDMLPQLPFPSLPGFDDMFPSPPEPEADPSLSMPAAPAASVFLRAMVDRTRAVVGEQVTLSIYQYTRSGSPDAIDVHESPASDFFQRSLLVHGTDPDTRTAQVGGNPWRVELIRKIALFPLKTGHLEIGPMRVTFAGFGMNRRNAGVARESNPVAVDVTEPPAEGRPVGFRGDVGSFALGAQVEPRKADAGGAIAVTVNVSGTGNLPATLPVPARTGIEWLDPETREKLEVRNDRIVGTRTFQYVVRLTQPGTVDLGELTLPFYDPDKHQYSIARAQLGTVEVRPGSAQPASSSDADRDPFASIAGPRPVLGVVPRRSTPWTEYDWFWVLIAAAPAAVLMAGAGSAAARKATERLRSHKQSPQRLAGQALAEARSAARAGDAGKAAAAVERSLHASIEAATGLRARGVLRGELGARLTECGMAQATAERVVEIFGECETIRFDPGASREQVIALVDAGEELSKKVVRGPTKGRS